MNVISYRSGKHLTDATTVPDWVRCKPVEVRSSLYEKQCFTDTIIEFSDQASHKYVGKILAHACTLTASTMLARVVSKFAALRTSRQQRGPSANAMAAMPKDADTTAYQNHMRIEIKLDFLREITMDIIHRFFRYFYVELDALQSADLTYICEHIVHFHYLSHFFQFVALERICETHMLRLMDTTNVNAILHYAAPYNDKTGQRIVESYGVWPLASSIAWLFHCTPLHDKAWADNMLRHLRSTVVDFERYVLTGPFRQEDAANHSVCVRGYWSKCRTCRDERILYSDPATLEGHVEDRTTIMRIREFNHTWELRLVQLPGSSTYTLHLSSSATGPFRMHAEVINFGCDRKWTHQRVTSYTHLAEEPHTYDYSVDIAQGDLRDKSTQFSGQCRNCDTYGHVDVYIITVQLQEDSSSSLLNT